MWGYSEVICFLAEYHTDLIRKFYQKANSKGIKKLWNYVSGNSFINLCFIYINKYISEESIPNLGEHWLRNRNDGEDKTVN